MVQHCLAPLARKLTDAMRAAACGLRVGRLPAWVARGGRMSTSRWLFEGVWHAGEAGNNLPPMLLSTDLPGCSSAGAGSVSGPAPWVFSREQPSCVRSAAQWVCRDRYPHTLLSFKSGDSADVMT